MSSGIRATVGFTDPGECAIARAAAAADSAITQVSTSTTAPGTGSVTEFLAAGSDVEGEGIEPVFSYGHTQVYRTRHEAPDTCPCECLGSHGCPVHRYEATAETLRLVFHAEDFETLQTVMETLREEYPPVDVQQLLQPPLEGSPEQRVFVNRGRLTDRQREVLEAAFEMGYFERPKQANATEIADGLGISQSTFTEHLMAAQRKLLEDIIADAA